MEDHVARPTIDPFTPAVELAAMVRRREVSPVELVDLYLDRIDELDGGLNAFCHRADEEVRKAASAAADVVMAATPDELPPFHGVPLPVKDLFDVAGWPSTYGSLGADRSPATTSDPGVQRFVDAGCLLLGKTTTSEFGAICFTESDALGITRNPWNPDRTPGGSSGGAGAAVGAGMAPLAFAGDGGGSIRIPASCNGLVGLKPTRGRVPGAVVEVEGLATSGVLARSVADAAASLDVLAEHDPAAWWSPPSPSVPFADTARRPAPALRIGVLTDAPIDGMEVDAACVTAVDVVLSSLAAAGHEVVDTPVLLPPPDELIGAFTTIWNLGGAGFPLADVEAVEPHNRALRDAARSTDSWTYAQAVHRTQRLSRTIVEAFVSRFDLLVTPTMACLPPPVGAWREGTDEEPMMALLNCYPMAVFTSLFNVTGLPAISVPVHADDDTGLPAGVQIVGAPWREDLLLQVSQGLEDEFAWLDRRPDLQGGHG
jgi:amidase